MELDDFKKGSRQTSIFLPYEVWLSAKQNLIEFRSALIFGVQFKIAEKQGFDYPANPLSDRILVLTKKIAELSQQIEDLKIGIPKAEKLFDKDLQEAMGDG